MLILVTNDDGVHAPGIRSLAKELRTIRGARVVVVAPDAEQSATSHAITLRRPLRIQKIEESVYSVDGTPADSVMLAVHAILKQKPCLVVSGINAGTNLGDDIHYSGTVSAAIEAAIMGIPAVAISLAGYPPYTDFKAAARFAKKISQRVLKETIPPGILLNVNVPNKSKIKGVRITTQGRHSYSNLAIEKMDPRGQPYYWLGGDPFNFTDIPDSDCNAYLENYIAVTPVHIDLTAHSYLSTLKSWKLNA
jgi:5'-nucleotidase